MRNVTLTLLLVALFLAMVFAILGSASVPAPAPVATPTTLPATAQPVAPDTLPGPPTVTPVVVTVPTPSTSELEQTDDDPIAQPDGSLKLGGTIVNHDPNWALVVTEPPTVQVLDPAHVVLESGTASLSSATIDPAGSVRWTYTTQPHPGSTVTSFERSPLQGRWQLAARSP